MAYNSNVSNIKTATTQNSSNVSSNLLALNNSNRR